MFDFNACEYGSRLEFFRYYCKEIAAYDIQTRRVDVYGEDQGYTERAFVLYDGLHYDALAQSGKSQS